MPKEEIDYTQLLETEYGQIVGHLIPELRIYEKMTTRKFTSFWNRSSERPCKEHTKRTRRCCRGGL